MVDKVKVLYYMCRDNNLAIARANELIGEIVVNEPIHDDQHLFHKKPQRYIHLSSPFA